MPIDEGILPFEGIFGEDFVDGDVECCGHTYDVHCKYDLVTVRKDEIEVFEQSIGGERHFTGGGWNEEETTAYLSLISAAIRHGTLPELLLPLRTAIREHPAYKKGPLPEYGMTRLDCEKHHEHGAGCFRTDKVSVGDRPAWLEQHKLNHERWRRYCEVRGRLSLEHLRRPPQNPG